MINHFSLLCLYIFRNHIILSQIISKRYHYKKQAFFISLFLVDLSIALDYLSNTIAGDWQSIH